MLTYVVQAVHIIRLYIQSNLPYLGRVGPKGICKSETSVIWKYSMQICTLLYTNFNELQWNLCIMDTLGPSKSVQITKVLVILYDKVTLGTSTKCLDYAGAHILKCPHQQISLNQI